MKIVGDQIVTSSGIGTIAFVGITTRFGGFTHFYSVSYHNSNKIDFIKVQ
jgi:hypothetical protein